MTPRPFTPAIVGARLDQMRQLLRTAADIGTVDAERLTEDRLVRAAVERILQALVDLAVDINAHLAVVELNEAPVTAKESFTAAARLGAIDESLAKALEPAPGLRNILVHAYVEIDVEKVAEAFPMARELFDDYVKQVASFLLRTTEPEEA